MTDYSDLAHRLRTFRPVYGWPEERAVTPTPTLGEQAAAALEAQAKEIAEKDARIAKLEAALKPFADANQFIIMFGVQWVKATEDDFRNARAALKGEK